MIALIAAAACASPSVWKPPDEPVREYPPRDRKVDLRVALIVTPEFREAKWARECCVMPVGPSLARNAEVLARHVFREVIAVDGDAAGAPADAPILTPRAVYIGRTAGTSGHSESIIALKVEWRLSARPNGPPIWLETVGGQATGRTGGNPEIILKRAIEDLFLRSERAMVESAAIRRAATQR